MRTPPVLLLLDPRGLVAQRVEQELAQRYDLVRPAADESPVTRDCDVVVIVCEATRDLELGGLPAELPKVVALSTRPTLADVVAAIDAGAREIANGDDASALVNAVDAALDRRCLEELLQRSGGLEPLALVERAHILSTLRAVDGNRALCSRILKLDRKTLYRKLKSYEVSQPDRNRSDGAFGRASRD